MLKICIVVNEIKYGGVEKVIENYCVGFDCKKYDFTIIAPDTSSREHMQHFRQCGFKIEEIPHKKDSLIKNIYYIYKIIKKGDFEIVHSHMSYANFYVLFIAKILGVRIRINHYHNVFNESGLKRRLLIFFNKLCDYFSTLNIFCSDAVKEYFGKTIHKSLVLYNIVKINEFEFNENYRREIREKYNIKKSDIVIGNVGRLTKQKNQQFILEIFSKIKKNNEKFKLLLCGDGEDRKLLEKVIRENRLFDDVILAGNTSEVYKMYNAMDVFLFPSIFEGLGLTFLEAQLNGLPCVGSDILPVEVVIGEKVKILSLQEKQTVWCSAISEMVQTRKNDIVLSKIERYSYEKHHLDMLKMYDYLKKEGESN